MLTAPARTLQRDFMSLLRRIFRAHRSRSAPRNDPALAAALQDLSHHELRDMGLHRDIAGAHRVGCSADALADAHLRIAHKTTL